MTTLCGTCKHDKRLHDSSTSIAEARRLAVIAEHTLWIERREGSCLLISCDCSAFTEPPLTIELDREIAEAYVHGFGIRSDGYGSVWAVLGAIRKALEASDE